MSIILSSVSFWTRRSVRRTSAKPIAQVPAAEVLESRQYLSGDAVIQWNQILLDAIRTLYTGHRYIPPAVGAKLAERMSQPQLSDRELEVLRLISAGKTNPEMCDDLCISESTIKFHINNIFTKLGVSDRTQAVIIAIKRGLTNL